MTKIIGFQAKIEKKHVSTQFENPSTNVIFGQLDPLGGFYKLYAGIFQILSFWPVSSIFLFSKMEKMPKNEKF